MKQVMAHLSRQDSELMQFDNEPVNPCLFVYLLTMRLLCRRTDNSKSVSTPIRLMCLTLICHSRLAGIVPTTGGQSLCNVEVHLHVEVISKEGSPKYCPTTPIQESFNRNRTGCVVRCSVFGYLFFVFPLRYNSYFAR